MQYVPCVLSGQLSSGTHVGLGAVLRDEGHPEVCAEEGARQPAPTLPGGHLLPHQYGPLEHTLACREGHTGHMGDVDHRGYN